MHTLIISAAFRHSRIFAGDSAGFEEEPGRQRPIASIAVDIVFAVYIPPHAPAPGPDMKLSGVRRTVGNQRRLIHF